MTDQAFHDELRGELRFNRSALHNLQQVDRTLVVSLQESVEALRASRIETSADHRSFLVQMAKVGADLEDLQDEIKANTAAVLHVLDELRGRGPSDGTT